MKVESSRKRRRCIEAAGLIALGLILAACDRQDERAERANTLVEAALDQLSNNRPSAPRGAPLERLAVEERAIAGISSSRSAANDTAAVRPARFAIGSIIAKPRQIAELEEAVLSQEMEAMAEPAEVERDIAASDTEPNVGIRAQSPRGLSPPPKPPGPVLQNRAAMRASRRLARAPEIREVQRNTQTRMLQTIDRLGLDGSVRAASGGTMVIDLFAEPTQFDGSASDEPLMATVAHTECPDNITPEMMRENKVLATECLVQALQASGEYEYCERDFIFEHQFARRPADDNAPIGVVPNDPLWDLQWNFRNIGEEEGDSAGGTGFVDFWTRQEIQGSRDVTVAVVDTGLALAHPDIANSPNIAPGWDMVSDPAMGNDGDGRDGDPNDPGDLCDPNAPFAADSYHGSHVAGTIGAAATNNGAGVAGGSWDVTLVPVRALGKCGGRLSDINDAIRWAGGVIPAEGPAGEEVWNENPADIINLSIGLFESCPASLQDAIDTVVERGAVVVAAAGNARLSTELYSPGGCANVITVAAGDARGHITPYSNFGPEVDIIAPGGDLSRDDDMDGRPDGILSTKPAKFCTDPVTGESVDNCYYALEQGTSMAAPHVSAALALIAAKYPEMTGAELESTLMSILDPRTTDQCAAECAQYPGATPIPDQPGMCLRACGNGWLNLEKLPD
ncbi:MAG: S8 family serine peptidase [Pseudomonadota bacterium]